MIPPLPKDYDVENRGHYTAGRLYPTKKPAKTKAKPATLVVFGNDVEGEDLSISSAYTIPFRNSANGYLIAPLDPIIPERQHHGSAAGCR